MCSVSATEFARPLYYSAEKHPLTGLLPFSSSVPAEKKIDVATLHNVKKIIQSGEFADIPKDLILNSGYVLLDFAIDNNFDECALFLVEQGAPVSVHAAELALKRKLYPIAESYIKAGNPIPKDFLSGAIPIGGYPNVDFIKKLVAKSAPDNNLCIYAALFTKDPTLVEFLLKAGYKANENCTAQVQNKEHFDLLLKYNAPITSNTFISIARHGWIDQCEILIRRGIVIPAQALNSALDAGHMPLVELLIKHKAPYNEYTLYSALQHAHVTGDMRTVELLLDYGIKPCCKTFVCAFLSSRFDLIDYLLDKGGVITEELVRLAINLNNLDVVVYLLKKKPIQADFFASIEINFCNEPLLEFLISNCKIIPSEESLIKAASLRKEISSLKFVKALIDKGAKPTPEVLSCAARFGNEDTVKYLIQIGVSTEKINISEVLHHEKLAIELLDYPNIIVPANIFQCSMSAACKEKILSYIRDKIVNKLGHHIQYLATRENVEQIIHILEVLPADNRRSDKNILNTIEKIFLYKSRYERFSFQEIVFFSSHPSPFVWKLLFPNFNVTKDIEQLSPFGFNPSVFLEILPVTLEAHKIEEDGNPYVNAYKLTVLFGSKERALEYLNKHSKSNHPVHNACLFELPKQGIWDIDLWNRFLRQYDYSQQKMFLIAQAPEIDLKMTHILTPIHRLRKKYEAEAKSDQKIKDFYRWEILEHMKTDSDFSAELHALLPLHKTKEAKKAIDLLLWKAIKKYFPIEYSIFHDKKPACEENHNVPLPEFFDALLQYRDLLSISYKDLIGLIVRHVYGNMSSANYDFALDCAKNGIGKDDFEKCIDILKKGPKPLSYIPEVKIEGKLIPPILQNNSLHFRTDDYIFETIPSTDPVMFLLGKKTSCCQSIDGHSKDCVVHGATQPYGGFVRILKRSSRDPWVAQSWVALTEDNELVFDSIEHNAGHDPRIIMALYALAATDILRRNPKIKRVVFGGGGNTPKQHSYPLQRKPKNGYSRIIGYKTEGYDSKESRYIIAEQGNLNLEHLKIVESIHNNTEKQPMTSDGLALIEGTDSFLKKGKTLRGLSLNTLDRKEFFEKHPKVEALLRRQDLNPLLEEGFYNNDKERERFGEYFLTTEAMEKLIARKIKNKQIILVDNDNSTLNKKLQSANTAEGEGILVGQIEGVHATAAYIERIDGKLTAFVVDSELPSENGSLIRVLKQHYKDITVHFSTEKLQVDHYSCSTFLLKAFSYFSKHGREALKYADAGRRTPAPLLKMGQKVDFEKLPPGKLEEIVSFKKGMTLGQYIQKHQVILAGKKLNAAAIRAKYRYYGKLEKVL